MIYLDNAATTWPKPAEVIEAITDCIVNHGANPGRGGHRMSLEAGRIIVETRELLTELFNLDDPMQVVFTGNATEALNIALKGLLRPGDHVVTTSMEHNSVARPLKVLQGKGLEVTEVQCSATGVLMPADVKAALKDNTKAIVMTHASNVTGTLMPVLEVGQIAREQGLVFMVDAAQTAGLYEIDVEKLNIDLLAFPGHKGLYGPQGTGALWVRKGIELVPLKEGGTGSNSESPYHPQEMPDRLESGTPNTPGIAGLGAGIKFLKKHGLEQVLRHEKELLKMLILGLGQIEGIRLYGPKNVEQQSPVVSFNLEGQGSSEVAFALDRVFQIASRSGLHCSPAAHGTLGTLEQGTVRLSLSFFNTEQEVKRVLEAVDKISEDLRK